MQRTCIVHRLQDGAEAEYDRRHAEVWPELVAEIRAAGVVRNTVFRIGPLVIMHAEHPTDIAGAIERVGASAVGKRWGARFADLLLPGGERALEVWNLD